MQVLLVTPRFRAGERDGGDVGATLLARELEARGVHVRVACEETDDPDVHAGPLTSRRIAHLATGADVVHAFHQGILAPTLRGARRAGVPAVATITAYEATCLWGDHTFPNGERCRRCTVDGLRRDYRSRAPDTVGRRAPALLARAVVAHRTLLLGGFDALLAPSEAARRRLVEAGAPPDALRVLPPMADPTWMQDPLPPLTSRGEAVFLGGLKHAKGPGILLGAAARLPALNVTFVGDGPELPGLRERARERGLEARVRFPGRVSHAEAGDLLATARVLVVPSVWEEPTARVVLEAWGLGVPVVASVRGAPGERITHEADGLLVPAGDPRALADTLRRVLEDDDLAERLRAGGRKQVEAHHPDRIAPRLLEVYQEVGQGIRAR